MIGSSPVVGSSKNIISGLPTIALASATLFFIPPDKSAGNLFATSSFRPTCSNFWIARLLAFVIDNFSLPFKNLKQIFCQTGRLSKRADP